MKKLIIFSLFIIFYSFIDIEFLPDDLQELWETEAPYQELNHRDLVLSAVRIDLKDFPFAYNPSLVESDDGLILAFRYCPDIKKDINSTIGVVRLDENLSPIGEPKLLKPLDSLIPPHAEDPRLIRVKNKIFIVYNDCPEVFKPGRKDRRDIFVAELICSKDGFDFGNPVRLIYPEKYQTQLTQKNWVPFAYGDLLLFAYTLNPHEILFPDLTTGICTPVCQSSASLGWDWGTLRGGTPAELWEGKYLAFFHSSTQTISPSSGGKKRNHFFFGAYTFSKDPPFNITKITPVPIIGEGFYSLGKISKLVVYPGGFVINDDQILIAFGKNDREIWIAKIDKEKLKSSLKSVEEAL